MQYNSAKMENKTNLSKNRTVFLPIISSSLKNTRQSETKNDQDNINKDLHYKPLMKFKCMNDIRRNSAADILFEVINYQNDNSRYSYDTVDSVNNSDFYPKKTINREPINENTESNLESKVFQSNTSPYFWFYKEKSKFSPYKAIKRPSLDNFQLMQYEISSNSNSNEILNKNLNDSKSSTNKVNVRNNYKNYKKKKESKTVKIIPKSYEEYKKYISYKLAQKHTRDYISSARLRELAVSEKFIPEAKRTIYIPHSHSLLPRSIGKKSIISFL
jgi:hypothetical protein